MPNQSAESPEVRFAFGKNWASYAALIGEHEIAEAEKGLLKLVPREQWRGRSLLDIGCGSGVHALAATRLGTSRIMAIDVDADSVNTTQALFERHDVAASCRAERIDLLHLDPEQAGLFDIVYSWGVLHHTGKMWAAIEKAASFVMPDGLLVIALYRSTRTDAFWQSEKRWYAQASPRMQRFARGIYLAAHWTACAIRGVSYRDKVANYRSSRGMDFYHDVHDWLGGYPYETALAPEVDAKMTALGLKTERVFARPMSSGLLGSGCDEYVYRRMPA